MTAPLYTPDPVDEAALRALLTHADVALLPGGILMTRHNKEVRDISRGAHQYLFESVALHPQVRLRDLFLLVDGDPLLKGVFRRDFVQEILAHVRPALRAPLKPVVYDPQELEFLELYATWHHNSSTGEQYGMDVLHLHGVGFVLKDALDEGYGCVHEAGSRIHWSISLSDPLTLLDLPLVVRTTADVCEDDIDSCRYGRTVRTVPLPRVRLAQLLHGVLYELSFHGAPEQTQAFAQSLREQVDEIKAGTAETHEVDLDELFSDDAHESLSAFLQQWAPLSLRAVRFALRGLEDDAPVQAALTAELGAAVVVQPRWKDVSCYAFRRALREHEREHRALRRRLNALSSPDEVGAITDNTGSPDSAQS